MTVPERAAKQAPGFHFCRMFQLASRAEPKLEATSEATNVRLSSEGSVVVVTKKISVVSEILYSTLYGSKYFEI